MTGLETVLGIAGTIVSAVGSIAAGQAQADAANAQAAAQERRAGEERAAAQRQAAAKAKEARLVMSRQQALAAASGGGAGDPTVMNLMGQVAATGDFNARSALYEGEARGRGLEDQAAIERMQAKQAKLAGFINAGSTILGGLSSVDWGGAPAASSVKPTFWPY